MILLAVLGANRAAEIRAVDLDLIVEANCLSRKHLAPLMRQDEDRHIDRCHAIADAGNPRRLALLRPTVPRR